MAKEKEILVQSNRNKIMKKYSKWKLNNEISNKKLTLALQELMLATKEALVLLDPMLYYNTY